MGYAMESCRCGMGPATEAVTAVTDWALIRFRLEGIPGIVHEDNPGSFRVPEKSGFALVNRSPGHAPPPGACPHLPEETDGPGSPQLKHPCRTIRATASMSGPNLLSRSMGSNTISTSRLVSRLPTPMAPLSRKPCA